MEQQNDVRKKRGGKHFTWEDRVRLEAFARKRYPKRVPNFSDLGRLLGRNRTTIGREYRRGETVNWDRVFTLGSTLFHFGVNPENSKYEKTIHFGVNPENSKYEKTRYAPLAL